MSEQVEDRPAISGHWVGVRQALGVRLAVTRQRVTFRDNQDVERTGMVVFWPGRDASPDAPHQPMANVKGKRHPVRELIEVHWEPKP